MVEAKKSTETTPFSEELTEAHALAKGQAIKGGHDFVDSGYLLLGLLEQRENEAARFLNERGVTFDRVELAVQTLRNYSTGQPQESSDLENTPSVAIVLERAKKIARESGDGEVSTMQVLAEIIKAKDAITTGILDAHVNVTEFQKDLLERINQK